MKPSIKACYCHACARYFHSLGIMSHRAAHHRRGEAVKITYTRETELRQINNRERTA